MVDSLILFFLSPSSPLLSANLDGFFPHLGQSAAKKKENNIFPPPPLFFSNDYFFFSSLSLLLLTVPSSFLHFSTNVPSSSSPRERERKKKHVACRNLKNSRASLTILLACGCFLHLQPLFFFFFPFLKSLCLVSHFTVSEVPLFHEKKKRVSSSSFSPFFTGFLASSLL